MHRHDHQILGHFRAREQFAELGDEQPRLQMAGQLLQLPHIFSRRVPHEIADWPFLPRLVEPSPDHLDDRLLPLRVFDVRWRETFVHIGHFLGVGAFPLQNLNVAGSEFSPTP